MKILVFHEFWLVSYEYEYFIVKMAGDVDDLSHESDDDSFRDHDVDESSESPDDDTDDNTTAADIPVQVTEPQLQGVGENAQVMLQVALQVALQVVLQVVLQQNQSV